MTASPFTRLRSGKMVRTFPSGALPDAAGSLGPAYSALIALTDAAVERAAAVQADPNLSVTGRKAALRAWLSNEAAPQLKRSRAAMAKAVDDQAALKASMTTAAIDKTDVAGALLRQELRAWLRGLEPAQRAGLLTVGPVDPQIAAAILEAPVELSGVTANQKAALQADALARANPEKLRAAEVTQAAMEALGTAEEAVRATLSEAMGLSRAEMDEALGAPNQIDRIRASLQGAGVGEDSAEVTVS